MRKTKQQLQDELDALKQEVDFNRSEIERLVTRNNEIVGIFGRQGLMKSVSIELSNADYPMIVYKSYHEREERFLFVKQTPNRVYWRYIGSQQTRWTEKKYMSANAMLELKKNGLID